jgi:hypothetical protein
MEPQNIDRVISFLSSRPNWDPRPLTLWFRGGGTLACRIGGGGVPVRTRGQTLWYSRYICPLWMERFVWCMYRTRHHMQKSDEQ